MSWYGIWVTDSESFDWSVYNTARRGRAPRALTRKVLDLAGPGRGRVAVDVGAGSGEDAALIATHGWTTHAVDQDPTSGELLTSLTSEFPVTFHRADFKCVAAGHTPRPWPVADLLVANYSAPFVGRDLLGLLMRCVVGSLRPGGWLALNFFGPQNSFADGDEAVVITEAQARAYLDSLDVRCWWEENELGQSFTGPHRWHNYYAVAQKPH